MLYFHKCMFTHTHTHTHTHIYIYIYGTGPDHSRRLQYMETNESAFFKICEIRTTSEWL